MTSGPHDIFEYMSSRFDRLEGQHDRLSQQVSAIDKKIVAIETKNGLISAFVAFLVVNFQNVLSFLKDKH